MMRQKNSNVQTTPLKEFAKKVAFRNTPFFKPTYPYNVHPIQLSRIISSIDEVAQDKSRRLCIVEVGVARGNTSRFIVEHVQRSGYDVGLLLCRHVLFLHSTKICKFEVEATRQDPQRAARVRLQRLRYLEEELRGLCVRASQSRWTRASSTSQPLRRVDFCFLDVDLYMPTKNVLANISQHMADPAILMCDDVRDEGRWDGSYQAFMEFVDANSLDYEIVGTKCGMVRFPQ